MNKLRFLLLLLIPTFSRAQSFVIGSIDFYGNRTVATSSIESALPFRVGDSINKAYFDQEAAEKKLGTIAGVHKAVINSVCCNAQGGLLMFIGIAERPPVSFYKQRPTKNLRLPDSMVHAYRIFLEKMSEGIQKGEMGEESDKGYAMAAYAPARKQQELYRRFAIKHFSLISQVLQYSRFDEHREAAASIIAYGNDKKTIAKLLTAAAVDTSEAVRNNATRALALLVPYGQKHPELQINVPASSFIQMLNSFTWTDRNKGAAVLAALSSKRDKNVLALLKKQALASLTEMAAWKSRSHAFYSFMMLGRMAGFTDEELIQKNFSTDYEASLKEILKKL